MLYVSKRLDEREVKTPFWTTGTVLHSTEHEAHKQTARGQTLASEQKHDNGRTMWQVVVFWDKHGEVALILIFHKT